MTRFLGVMSRNRVITPAGCSTDTLHIFLSLYAKSLRRDGCACRAGQPGGFLLGLLGGGSDPRRATAAYVVGVSSVHVAVSTSALAVSINAFANLIGRARTATSNGLLSRIWVAGVPVPISARPWENRLAATISSSYSH
jgi:hypothetical protein